MLHPIRRLAVTTLALLAAACSGGPSRGPADGYSERSWAALALPRPTPRPDAPRVAVAPVEGAGGLTESVGTAELVLLRFLTRTDIWMVDRRRYSLAAARMEHGLRLPPTAPPLGRSPEVQFMVRARVGPPRNDQRVLTMRLVEAASGRVRARWRDSIPGDASTVALARAVGTLLETGLEREGLLVASGAEADEAPRGGGWSGASIRSPDDAFRAFMEGVVAEDRYNWGAARAAYTRAQSLGGPTFVEPITALSRVARLRAGGALGTS